MRISLAFGSYENWQNLTKSMQFILQFLIRLMLRTQFFVCRTVKPCYVKSHLQSMPSKSANDATAKNENVLLMEGIGGFPPVMRKLRDWVKQGKLGKLELCMQIWFLPKEKS